MATIGNIDIGARLSLSNFTKGLTSLRGQLASFSSGIEKMASSTGTWVAAIGAGAAVAGLSALVTSSMDAMDAASDLSQQLGTTVGNLTALQHAANLTGSSAEALGPALQKMNINLSEASTKGGTAAEAFTKLGLDANKLKEMDPSLAFVEVADALSKIPNSSDRAAAAMDIFGKGGINILNTLGAGKGTLQDLMKEAERLGVSFNEIDAAKIGEAKDQMDRLGAVMQGVGNLLAIEVAPVITELSTQFLDWANNSINAGEVVSTAVSWTATAIGIVADMLNLVMFGFKTLQATVTSVIAALLAHWSTFAEGIQFVLNLLPGVSVTFGDTLSTMAEDMKKLAGEQWGEVKDKLTAPPPSTAIETFMTKVQSSAQAATDKVNSTANSVHKVGDAATETAKKVGDLTDKLSLQIATFGMTSDQVEIYKLKQAGASTAVIANIEAMQKQIAAMEADKKIREQIQSDAKANIEASRTPLEKYELEIAKLQTQMSMGLLDPVSFQRSVERAKAELDKPAIEARKKAEDDLKEQAKQVIEATKNPLEKYKEELTKLDGLLAKGLISPEVYNRAKKEADESLKDTQTQTGTGMFANSLQLGSNEARAAILRNRGFSGKDPMSKVEKNTKDQVELAKSTNGYLKTLVQRAGGDGGEVFDL